MTKLKTFMCGVAVMLVSGMVVFQPKPDAPEATYVELHPIHMACGFESESYEPSEYKDGIKWPMSCGCSELKGTCFNHFKLSYVEK